MDLLTIGAFARLARLSPKAMRLYDDLRLLPPVHVDPDTGYRWYSPDQLTRARQVARLRQLDMPLARIRTVLDRPPGEAADELVAYWNEQEQAWRAKKELAGFLLDQLTGKETTLYDVFVRSVPERILLTTGEYLSANEISDFATPLFTLFAGPTISRPEGRTGRPFLRYHGEISNDSEGLVEFCCPLSTSTADETAARFPDMTPSAEQAGREAYISVPKADMMTALGVESLDQWLADHDEHTDWQVRQIFLCDPATADLTEPVYELAIPLR